MGSHRITNGPLKAPITLGARFTRTGREGLFGLVPGSAIQPPAPQLQLQQHRFIAFGFSSVVTPPAPVQVFYSGSGPLEDYFPGMSNGPATYPNGLRFWRKYTLSSSANTGDEEFSNVGTVEYVWDSSDLRFYRQASGEDFDIVSEVATEVLDRWLDDWFDANPSASDEEAAVAVTEFFQANSSYTEDGWTYSISHDGRSASETYTLSEEDTFADLKARAEDWVANATDAQWASPPVADGPESTRSRAGESSLDGVQEQNGLLWRAADPQILSGRIDRYVFAVRYHHVVPAPRVPGPGAGAWTLRHRRAEWPGIDPYIFPGNNSVVRAPAVPGSLESPPPLPTITQSGSSVSTTTWSEPAGRYFDARGNPHLADDPGWDDLPWVEGQVQWGSLGGRKSAAVKLRLRAIDRRAGWSGTLRARRRRPVEEGGGLENVDFPFTTGAGGVTAVLIFSAPESEWRQNSPQIFNVVNPEGVALGLAAGREAIRLENRLRCGLERDADFRGPTGLWFARRTLRTDYTLNQVLPSDFPALGVPISSATGFFEQVEESVESPFDPGPGEDFLIDRKIVSTTSGLTVNGVDQPVQDALRFQARLLPAGVATTVTTFDTDFRTVTVNYASAPANGSLAGVEVQRFPIGWEGVADPLAPVEFGSSGRSFRLMRETAPSPASQEVFTDTLVYESRLPSYPSETWRSPWRGFVVGDADVVVGITEGWALWVSPEEP